ncbi:MAG: lamin tail domain-containing protein [Candidatus Viridilinea halotolerans]|uniref:Lamin tail domain-containing protein n=1 Tax=Candidatus Viridilinea halotolerans TaxID=2491704 RepID=A0A426TRU8_9CHLR|nr:MAG: lamin tail domain-containing protein [Candidatus Viridilinea halotolerans]
MRTSFARRSVIALAFVLLLGTLPASYAQSDVRTFPETGHTLRGAFRVFWESYGGARVFGYPISEEVLGNNGRIVQWFERARFELAVGGDQPRVELGNLGLELAYDRIFPKVPPIEDSAERRYIPQTQHIVQYGFKEIWERYGAEQIFGYPISEEIYEVLENGNWHTVQYFEKARFEYWPELPPGERVLLSHLGRRLIDVNLPPPPVAPAPPPVAPAPPPVAPAPPPPIPSPTPAPVPALPPPSYNNCAADPNPNAAPNYPVRITDIDKGDETVTLQNVSPEAINLDGWHMCSITGNQEHPIEGTLAPGQSRMFSGPAGYIWNNEDGDDGALYNERGQLVSYWFDPDNN